MEFGWGTRPKRVLFKGLASLFMVLFALSQGILSSFSGGLFFGGLLLSGLGDVLLAREGPKQFFRGLFAFLLAHLAYTVGFLSAGVDPVGAGYLGLLTVPVAFVAWRRFSRASEELRKPVTAYILGIGLMLLAAAGACWSEPTPARQILLVSAVAFAASDVFVAQDHLIKRDAINVVVGLPLYYAAQLGIGLGAAGL